MKKLFEGWNRYLKEQETRPAIDAGEESPIVTKEIDLKGLYDEANRALGAGDMSAFNKLVPHILTKQATRDEVEEIGKEAWKHIYPGPEALEKPRSLEDIQKDIDWAEKAWKSEINQKFYPEESKRGLEAYNKFWHEYLEVAPRVEAEKKAEQDFIDRYLDVEREKAETIEQWTDPETFELTGLPAGEWEDVPPLKVPNFGAIPALKDYHEANEIENKKEYRQKKPKKIYNYIENIKKYYPIVMEESEKQGFPPELIFGIIHAESKFNPNAETKWAQGIMQIAPGTFSSINKSEDPNIFDPKQNIMAGTDYLRKQIKDMKRKYRAGPEDALNLALVAYNRGPCAAFGPRPKKPGEKKTPDPECVNHFKKYPERKPKYPEVWGGDFSKVARDSYPRSVQKYRRWFKQAK
jgi:hypothetical protein